MVTHKSMASAMSFQKQHTTLCMNNHDVVEYTYSIIS